MNIFKRIWNYFFPEKKKVDIKDSLLFKPAPQKEIIKPKHINTQQFNKQQLVGKLMQNGKDSMRVKRLILLGNNANIKYKYEVELT